MSQDSWAKDDKQQQDAFQKETAKLWKFAQGSDLFAFRTVQDVLAENKELKDEIKYLNNVITQNITELQKDIKQVDAKSDDNKGLIKTNQDSIKDTQLATDDLKANLNILSQVYLKQKFGIQDNILKMLNKFPTENYQHGQQDCRKSKIHPRQSKFNSGQCKIHTKSSTIYTSQ